ncbi:type II secretion system F family protein [Sulfurimonas sp. C5]|uniref:type II secretion system F family protein n=1 Tax=Sulfurimonas sp. C5 TaxID=3036947 RepID=UPI002458A60E|nr:type II secretion system F family protein [Sulfurimonas sp. C5]MDH4944306.1 type II secretion system F family protein [Sulfurimonas sp. C5]
MIGFATLLLVLSIVFMGVGLFLLLAIKYKHYKLIHHIFNLDDSISLISKSENRTKEKFKVKLTRAGLTQKAFNEILLASILAGASIISLVFILNMDQLFNILFVIIGLGIMGVAPFLYIDEQMKARITRIENDLAIFIDLLIIILEGGGGLNNAIDKVTQDATDVLGKDLIEESKIFKYEFITYGNEVACTNLATRTGSEAIATIAGFMRLSEETGIGVKSVFENQAVEIKQEEMLNIEKKAATMNIKITFIMFLFILPAIIAMMVFPMAADALMPGF